MTDTSPEALIDRLRKFYAGSPYTELSAHDQDVLGLCNQVEKVANELRDTRAENKIWSSVIDRMFAALTRRDW